jgi:excisionase family DNA binding protein
MKDNSSEPRLVGPEEAAAILGLKVSTIYNWVHRRKIPFRKHGRLLRFDAAALHAWSKAQEFEAHKR